MIGGPMKFAVNDFILNNPALAADVVGGLVAGGIAAITLSDIIRYTKMDTTSLTPEQRQELRLLEEQAPENFFGSAVQAVHFSFQGWKMRGKAVLPHVGWLHDKWGIKNMGITSASDPFFDEDAVLVDLIDVQTPAMDRNGKLV